MGAEAPSAFIAALSEEAFAQRIRRFFQTLGALRDVALLLEGMPRWPYAVAARDDVNRWTLIGLGARQRVQIQGQTLSIRDAASNSFEEALSCAPEACDRLFQRLREVGASCRQFSDVNADLPFSGGLMGWIGYEFGQYCDPALADALNRPQKPTPPARDWPDLWLVECEDWLVIDRRARALTILSERASAIQAYRSQWRAAMAAEVVEEPPPQTFCEADAAFRDSFEASLSPAQFQAGVARLQRAIAEGDIYQANLSIRFSRTLSLDPRLLYETLCQRNPSPFSGWAQWPGHWLLSNSPERLASVAAAGAAHMRPIAGTRGRGASAQEDAAIAEQLRADPKERAEHLMLVDLARNDLGRACRAGSVSVNELLTIERYSHVTHLVSAVSGQIKPGADAWDVLRATFPGGTITGCPKIRCVELLADVEPVARGPYTGGLGYWDAASGRMDLNILIRTVTLRSEGDGLRYNAAFSVGAGIVADSVAEREYRECMRKAAALWGALFTCQRPTSTPPQEAPPR
ncbi:MAG: anthranilate synthase component I family protein [Vampirovibrionales bacterium]|nr:anthranilate synthase component I family protein [Vampirovibrionales bacterium]